MSLSALSSRAIIGRYYQTLENLGLPPWVDALSMEMPSNQDSETYKMILQSPVFRKWVGGRIHKGLAVEGFTIPNDHFEATLDVECADLRRDKTGQIMIRVDDLARRTQQHWNKILSERILNGHTSVTTYGATSSPDGQDFFDDDHSVGDSGTQQNDIDVTDVPSLNLTLGAPTAAEMAAAILDTITYMHAWLDDQGEPMNEEATQFAVMVGLPLFYGPIVQACTLNNLSGGGAINNPLTGGGFKVTPIYNARLASATTQMWVFRTDTPVKPFIRQVETPVSIKHIGAGSQLEFDHDMWSWGVDAWRGCGYGAWQYAARCTLS
jgi:phage major head subunit gpT-like protein